MCGAVWLGDGGQPWYMWGVESWECAKDASVEFCHVHRATWPRLTTMGKRKKSSRKPTGPRRREPLGTIELYTSICYPIDHILQQRRRSPVCSVTTTSLSLSDSTEKRVSLSWSAEYVISGIRAKLTVRLSCLCDPAYSFNHRTRSDLTEPIDVYSEWIDAADAAQREEQTVRRGNPSSSRPVIPLAPPSDDDDDDDDE
jgi:transcription elongation factor Elf1